MVGEIDTGRVEEESLHDFLVSCQQTIYITVVFYLSCQCVIYCTFPRYIVCSLLILIHKQPQTQHRNIGKQCLPAKKKLLGLYPDGEHIYRNNWKCSFIQTVQIISYVWIQIIFSWNQFRNLDTIKNSNNEWCVARFIFLTVYIHMDHLHPDPPAERPGSRYIYLPDLELFLRKKKFLK